MTFDVEVRGRRHHVEIVRSADGDHVSIDGRMFASHVAGASPFQSLLVEQSGAGTAWSRSYEITVEPDEASGTLVVGVDGTLVPVRLVDRRRSRPRTGLADAATDAFELRAPMPGRIVRLLVADGDRVAARQGLVVIEAMKMENELYAPMAGVVTGVRVEAGSTVEANGLLLVVTAQPSADS